MKTELLTYLKANWFKVSLAAILVFVALKKDLSFHINLNSPVEVGQPLPEESSPTQPVTEDVEERGKAFTEQVDQKVEPKTASTIDRLDFLPFSKSKTKRKKAYDHLNQVDASLRVAYIKRFTHVALSEQKKFGIPASITLGNSLLISRAGQKELSKEGNNYFAIPCTSDWQGESGVYDHQCFRHYENAWTSFRDHSLYLTTGEMARNFQGLDSGAYKKWAQALEKADYSSEKDFAKQLIQVIQDYRLFELDEM